MMMTDDRARKEVERDRMERRAAAGRLVSMAAVTLAALYIAAVVTYSLVRVNQAVGNLQAQAQTNARTLKIEQDQQDPNSPQSQMALQRLVQFVNQYLVTCLENHSDRVGDQIRHVPMVRLAPHCPVDGLGP